MLEGNTVLIQSASHYTCPIKLSRGKICKFFVKTNVNFLNLVICFRVQFGLVLSHTIFSSGLLPRQVFLSTYVCRPKAEICTV